MKTTWLINKEFSNFYKFPWTLWDNPYTDLFSLFSIVLDTKANKTKPSLKVFYNTQTMLNEHEHTTH